MLTKPKNNSKDYYYEYLNIFYRKKINFLRQFMQKVFAGDCIYLGRFDFSRLIYKI